MDKTIYQKRIIKPILKTTIAGSPNKKANYDPDLTP